jgi:glycolate oxidase FAD binding subunit
MLCGSFGSLAVITRAIFKLVPLAAASRTVVATAGDLRRLSDLAVAIAAGPLTPSAVELEAPVGRLLIRIESSPASADRQAALACEACEKAGAAAAIVSAAEEGALWQAHENLPAGEGALLRVSVLPTDVGTLLDEVDRIAGAAGLGWQASGQAALGTMRVLLESPPTAAARTAEAITKLRQGVATRGGSAIVLAAHPDVRSRVVPWGTAGDALPLMQTVKARFDPNGILPRGPWALGTRR